MYGMNSFQPAYMHGISSPPLLAQDKGKGKMREIDFEAAFAQIDAALGPAKSTIEATTTKSDEADEISQLANDLGTTTLQDENAPTSFKE